MHGLIRVPNPPAGRILDIVRSPEKPQKNPAPVTTQKA
jgi:hypothetical protein